MEKNNNLMLSGTYDYHKKLQVWKTYATRNKVAADCENCKKVHARKTVLLENGQHVCWYCWIRKGSNYGTVVFKPSEMILKQETPTKKIKQKEEKTKKVASASKERKKTMEKTSKGVKSNSDTVHIKPVVKKAIDNKIVVQKKPVESEAKTSTPAPAPVVAKVEETQPVVPAIRYSKWNPQLTDKQSNVSWNVVKYGAIILALVFGILALYFASIWQTTADGGFLAKLGFISAENDDNGNLKLLLFNIKLPKDITSGPVFDSFTALKTTLIGDGTNRLWYDMSLAGATFYTNALNTCLMVFGILMLAMGFPLMVFKNKTAWGLSILVVEILFILVTATIFFIGIAAQETIVGELNSLKHLISHYGSTKDLDAFNIAAMQQLNKLHKFFYIWSL
ncbi:MAG: hypothetical protein ACRC4L_03610 [Mycoplasma sp.]